MSTIATVRNCLNKIDLSVTKLLLTYGEMKNIRRKKQLYDKVKLSAEENAQIDAFYREHYGKTISKKWHRLYQSYTGAFCLDYFPEILFSAKLEPLLNPRSMREVLGDKNLLSSLFADVPGLHIPVTYASCVYGVLRNGANELIDYQQLEGLLQSCICVIKKTIDTSSGRDVQLCRFVDGIDQASGEQWQKILRQFGDNFVVQELIEQHECLSRVYPKSVNTFRIITYIVRDEIHICPIALRVGRNGADRDNNHYGGISIGVMRNGQLRAQAYSEMGEKYEAHQDTGVRFKDVIIPYINELVASAKRCHACCPWLRILSWDMAIDNQGKPVLIEVNTGGQSTWFPQYVNGEPLFGDDTAYMLELIRKNGSKK